MISQSLTQPVPQLASRPQPKPRAETVEVPQDEVVLSQQPDLLPTGLDLNLPVPGKGDMVSMWLTVANRGEADAGPFRVSVRDQYGYRTSASVRGVPQGRSQRVFLGPLQARSNPWLLTATVDEGNRVAESNERNNSGQATVIVRD